MSDTPRSEFQSFARLLSHDMASLIRSARQLSAYAREDVLREDADAAMHALGMLDVRLAGLDRLVSELVRYHRAGQRTLQWESCSITQVLQSEFSKLSAPSSARLLLNITHDRVVCDPVLLRTVFAEIIGNAIVHHDAAEQLVLTIDAVRSREGRTLLQFQDNGRGLPAGTTDRVLEPFIKLDGKAGRAGLGLAICKRELDAGNGRISIRPNSDGCCVVVTLPEAPADVLRDDSDTGLQAALQRRPHLKLV